MKIAHIGDPHLGIRQYGKSTATGQNVRERDVAAAFAATIDQVIATRPNAVLVAGDLFHNIRPPNSSVVFASQQFHKLRTALPDSPIVLIGGNHDIPRSTDTGNILPLFKSAGVDVASFSTEWFRYTALNLAILAVPHSALVTRNGAKYYPEGNEKYKVLCLHGEIAGVFPTNRESVEPGGGVINLTDVEDTGWDYIALGHYHVQCKVSYGCWYAGAIEYVSTNIWGEIKDEAKRGINGKGWLLVDLDNKTIENYPIPLARKIHDLKVIDAKLLTPEQLRLKIAERVEAIGIKDKIVRLVVTNVTKELSRQIDHVAVRKWKAEALHFNLDLRRPPKAALQHLLGKMVNGERQSIPEIVKTYLERRDLPPGMNHKEFLRLGLELMDMEKYTGEK